MARLTPQHWDTLRKVFELEGFVYDRTKSSHYIMKKQGMLRALVIPMYSEVQVYVIGGLLRTARLTRRRYLELLDQV